MSNLVYESTLYHHGIKGQKWGVRRFQNTNGSYTSEGKKRYSSDEYYKDQNRFSEEVESKYVDSRKYRALFKEADRIATKWDLDRDDGGGGKKNTPQSERDRYLKISQKAADERDRIYTPEIRAKINKEVTKKLLDTYGESGIRAYKKEERRNTIEGGAAATAAVLTLIGGGILVGKGISYAGDLATKGIQWAFNKTIDAIANK